MLCTGVQSRCWYDSTNLQFFWVNLGHMLETTAVAPNTVHIDLQNYNMGGQN